MEVRARRNQPLGMPPARFLRDYWQKRPLLVRGAFPGFSPRLSPDDLAGLACLEGALARIVMRSAILHPSSRGRRGVHPTAETGTHPAVSSRNNLDPGFRRDDVKSNVRPTTRNDRWDVRTGPFDEATFAKLPESDWTLLVQDVDKWDTDTDALLDHFAFIPEWRIDDVMVSYAVDGGGVGAHVDQYDVFLLQGLGQRRWAIDTRPDPSVDFRDDVELKLLQTFAPTHAWTLDPGDMLYLPPGVPHDGVAVGECMTFSVGMRAPSAAEMLADFAQAIAERLPEDSRYADPDLVAVRASGEIDDAALARVATALPWLRSGSARPRRKHAGNGQGVTGAIPPTLLREWFGGFITRYRAAQTPVPRKRPIDRKALARGLSQTVFERDPWTRFAWCRHGRDALLFASGSVLDAPTAWARALAGRRRKLDGASLAELPHRDRGVALLASLIDAGHLRPRRRR